MSCLWRWSHAMASLAPSNRISSNLHSTFVTIAGCKYTVTYILYSVRRIFKSLINQRLPFIKTSLVLSAKTYYRTLSYPQSHILYSYLISRPEASRAILLNFIVSDSSLLESCEPPVKWQKRSLCSKSWLGDWWLCPVMSLDGWRGSDHDDDEK